MNKLVKLILDKNLNEAKEVFQTEMLSIVERKLVEAKKMAAAKDALVVRKAFDGSQGARAEKLYRDVVEEIPVLEGEYDEALDEKYGKGYQSPASKIEKAMKAKGVQPNSSDKYRKEMEKLDAQYAELKAKDKKIDEDAELDEENLDEAPRVKIIRARIRGGKVQRRKKVSTVAGFTFRSGKLKRMSPMERRRRKMGQRRGKIKRRAKLSRALMKRQRSMRKRQSMGLK